tara:strand:- start:2494 stop:3762 length:1269 start_codon:yes stop_codon:yes gene_type:complete
MKYLIVLLLLLYILKINEFFSNKISCKKNILEYNNYNLNLHYEKLNPNNYILINDQLNFNTDSTKNTLDPKILLNNILNNIIGRKIIDVYINNTKYNNVIKHDYPLFLKDIEYMNIQLILQTYNYFKLYLEDKDNKYNFNCDNIYNCKIRIYDYYIYSIDYSDKLTKYNLEELKSKVNKYIIKYDLQYIFKIDGSEYLYIFRFKIKRFLENFIVEEIISEGLTTTINNSNDYNNNKKLWVNKERYDFNTDKGYYGYNTDYNNTYFIDNLLEIVDKENINTNIIETFEDNEYSKYKCYGSDGINKYECENNYDNYGNKKEKGVWDKMCNKNEDCPFYKSNKNYKNEFGGCINGYCQLPLNMESISPHNYKIDSNKQPFCHNYKNNNYDSCYLQNNKKLYPKLKSPDYAFENDNNIRSVNYKGQ